MTEFMVPYINLVNDIRTNGRPRGDRTGTGTVAIFGRQLRFDLRKGFPLLSLKYTSMKDIVAELLWLLSGSSDNNLLNTLECKIWNKWAIKPEHLVGRDYTHDERVEMLCRELKRIPHGPNAQEILQSKEKTEAALLTFDIPTKEDDLDSKLVGQLGPIYGCQWREWTKGYYNHDICDYDSINIDQIQEVITSLKENPYSRRHIVSAWNVSDLPSEKKKPWDNVIAGKMSLAPCHTLFQFYVEDMTSDEILDANPEVHAYAKTSGMNSFELTEYMNKLIEVGKIKTRRLSCQLYQRSADTPIGLPYNIASYSLLTHLMANECGMEVGDFILTIGDTHIYQNQWDGVNKMLDRIGTWDSDITIPRLELGERKLSDYLSPTPTLAQVTDLAGCLKNYNPLNHIPIPVAT